MSVGNFFGNLFKNKCPYCGKDTAMFQNHHKDCKDAYDAYARSLIEEATKAASGLIPLPDFQNKLTSTLNIAPSLQSQKNAIVVKGWEAAVTNYLDDNLISPNEERNLMAYSSFFSLSQNELDHNKAWTRCAMGAALHDVMNTGITKRITFTNVPFNLQKDEQLVWMFNNTRYLEEKTYRQYVGSSQGVSIRIARGVYYRVGSFKGHPVESSQMVHIDTGVLGLTTKNIYFTGTRKSTKIPYKKIVNFNPYSDGIGIHRDAASAKPQVFILDESWFAYNLMVNLAQL